jgi:streptomycin 6-kinase
MRIRIGGPEAKRWMNSLPDRVRYLAAKWRFTPGKILSGGSESLVLLVDTEGHGEAVVKLGLPGTCDCGHEAKVLQVAAGNRYVTLLDEDAEANALLLERLGVSLAGAALSVDRQIEALCETLSEAWIPVESSHWLMTGGEKALWLADFIDSTWTELSPRLPGEVRDVALACAAERRRAHSAESSCLVHGDAHEQNALYALDKPDGLKFVDPDGLFAERACDLAVLMRGWNQVLLGGDALALGRTRCKTIASLTGVDEHTIWQWGFMERVSTGLLLLQIGMEQAGRETLAVARAWAKAK